MTPLAHKDTANLGVGRREEARAQRWAAEEKQLRKRPRALSLEICAWELIRRQTLGRVACTFHIWQLQHRDARAAVQLPAS